MAKLGTAHIKVSATSGRRITDEEITNWFTYHPPRDQAQIDQYAEIRAAGEELALLIRDSCPPSADTTAAVRSVRQAVMWANASIACDLDGA